MGRLCNLCAECYNECRTDKEVIRMHLNDLLRTRGMEYMDRFYRDLPQSDRDLIDSVSALAAKGSDMALALLKTVYAYGETQAARLYYGAHAGDPYACLLLGMYHLHGKYVFARSTTAAEYYLQKAAESPWAQVSAAAHREIACMHAGTADMELRGYTLVKYSGSDETVVLPAMVKEIGSGAFKGNRSVRNVILPGCVEYIGDFAFAGCANLEKINWPSGLLTIGASAFADCVGLTDAALPEGLQTLGSDAFAGCRALKKVIVPGSVARVGDSAFRGSGVQDAFLHKGVRQIGDKAFAHTPLERVYCTETLEEIGKGAFEGCDALAGVYEYSSGHYVRRPVHVQRGNRTFERGTARVLVMQEENCTLTFVGEDVEKGEVLSVEGMPSRADEAGYGTVHGWIDSVITTI